MFLSRGTNSKIENRSNKIALRFIVIETAHKVLGLKLEARGNVPMVRFSFFLRSHFLYRTSSTVMYAARTPIETSSTEAIRLEKIARHSGSHMTYSI